MKKLHFTFAFLFIIFFSCSSPDDSEAKLTIGQDYQGGVIFYLEADGKHGLIVAYERTTAKWGCSNVLIDGANGMDYGTGQQNTIDIVNGCSEEGIAARYCEDYVSGSYSDWYLPSASELRSLHRSKDKINNVFLNQQNLWSSTQVSSGSARYLSFYGNPGEVSTTWSTKDNEYQVSPIRSF